MTKRLILTQAIHTWNDGKMIKTKIFDPEKNEYTDETFLVQFMQPPTKEEYCKHCCGMCKDFIEACPVLIKAGYTQPTKDNSTT